MRFCGSDRGAVCDCRRFGGDRSARFNDGKLLIPRDEILWDEINQFARRHVGSPQVAQGAVRCPIAFEWRDVLGEGDTLKRSDTAAVTWLLNFVSRRRQSIAAQ